MRRLPFSIAVLVLFASLAQAQTPSDRPIKLLVPLASGSAVDIVARLVAEKMGDQLGQRPYVENQGRRRRRDRHAGRCARRARRLHRDCAERQRADHGADMKSDAGYDPFADFMPVTQLVGIPLGLIAHPSFEANTSPSWSRSPRRRRAASTIRPAVRAARSTSAWNCFVRAAGIQMTHVPHRGATEAVTAIVSGSVPIGITGMSAVVPLPPRQAGQAARA